jgi:hypothetical protein
VLHPLSLTVDQVKIVEEAARRVPAIHRQDFMAAVVDLLSRSSLVTDAAVVEAAQVGVVLWSQP